MGFYQQISKYYDYIFPSGKEQLKFIKESTGLPEKKILDVACGSGTYSIELAKLGFELTATDLDDEMVRLTKEKAKAEGLKIDVLKCDMRELEDKIQTKFDGVFCIGNSIVHLGSIEDIFDTLKQMYNLLEKDGVLILQIINYDRIIKFHVSELPVVKNNEIGLEFIRKYEYIEENGLINFNTTLTVSNGGVEEKYENSVELLPVLSSEMNKLLMEAGFAKVQLFGDFNYSPYHEGSYMLVVKAVK